MPDDLFEACVTKLQEQGLEDRLVQYRLVPLPMEPSTKERIIVGSVLIFLGIIIGSLIWIKEKNLEQ